MDVSVLVIDAVLAIVLLYALLNFFNEYSIYKFLKEYYSRTRVLTKPKRKYTKDMTNPRWSR
jgi:regulatory protein YycH of two-component signal transduction system YycFG